MLRYFYAWTPLVIVIGTVVLLTVPYLGLIALPIVALAVLTVLVWAIVSVPYMLGRAIARRWHERTAASRRQAPWPSRIVSQEGRARAPLSFG